MDNVTHSLAGALMGQMGLKKKTGLGMPALIIGANIPDVDSACFFWLEGTEHLGFRRGITHGPPAMVLLPLVLAAGLWWFDRWQEKRGKRPEGRRPVNFKWLYILSLIGCLSHPALDWLNVYGVRFLEPFSSQWFYGDTLFIIDLWLIALMGLAVWWSLRKEKRGAEWKRPAWIAAAVSLAYIGMNGAISQSASHHDHEFHDTGETIASPVPFAFWQREVIVHVPDADPEIARPMIGNWSMAGGLGSLTPMPDKPLVFVQEEERELKWTREIAASEPQVGTFLFWSRVPFAACSDAGTVALYDARFYDPRARDRFSVALPDVKCVPAEGELPAQ